MKRISSRFVAVLWAAALTLATAAMAQEAPNIPLLDRAAVMQTAEQITAAKYPDADDVLVDDLILATYQPDGSSVTTDETWMKVLTEKGRRDNQKLSLGFNQAYGDVSVDILEAIKPDGTVVPVDIAKQGRVMTERAQMRENIYDPNNKVYEVGIPGLAVGDVVHYRAIHRLIKPRVPKTWSDYNTFEAPTPICRMTYIVNGPKSLPLRSIALKDPVPGTVTFTKSEEGDRLLYHWEVRDVPRMHEEPSMPPVYTCVQRLLVSTIADWQEISRWYWQISLPHLQPTDAMKETVWELTKGLTDRQKRIEALFQYVSQKIRYMGITLEKESPGYEPHDVRITFDNKYGVCRDKAALLVEMLRLAEFQAFPVLIHVGPKKDADVPQPYFNHAIVAVRNDDGSYTLMDPTDENTRELLPAYLSNDSYLVATPEGDPLRTTPIAPATGNLMRVDTAARLNANGDLTAECVLHFDGINDSAYRGYFSRVQPEERRTFFEGLARRAAPGARLSGYELTPADLTDMSVPLTARLRFEARDVPVSGDGVVLLPLPRVGTRVGMVNFLLGNTGLEKRKYPLVTEIACGVQETLTLESEGIIGRPLALPRYESVENDAVSFTPVLSHEGNTLKRSETFLMKVVEFTPAQYQLLKGALKTMEFDARQSPIFAPVQAESDALVLSDTITYDLQNARNWTETRAVKLKVLTYAGKKKLSDLKLNYNPVWEEMTVEGGKVTNPDGSVKEVKPEEQNLMDAPWVGSAPRYPAGKTLVVSLPGVEVGSVIEYQVRRVCKNQPFFAARDSFRGMNPIQSKRVQVVTPAGLDGGAKQTRNTAPFLLNAQALFAEAIQESTGEGKRTWSAANQTGVKPEPQLPPTWAFTPTVCLSTGTWPAYAAEVSKALEAAAARQKETQQQARTLIKGVRDRTARLLAIRDFVARQIRDVGPDLNEIPFSAITPADRTLSDTYGNSADRAVLLVALLREAGFSPAFVLASGASVIENCVHPLVACPNPEEFDAVLVRVKLDDGRMAYLNDTSEYAALGATAHDGHYGLDLKEGRVITLRALPEMADRSDVQYDLKLLPTGDARIVKTTRYYGGAYAEGKRNFAELLPEERSRYFQEAVARIAQAATPEGELVTRFDRYPGVEEFTVNVKGYAIRDNGYFYFALPETLADLYSFRSETRENPIYFPEPRRVAVRTAITLPPEFITLDLKPQPLAWKAPQGAGTVALRMSEAQKAGGTEWSVEQSAELAAAILPASDYDSLLRLQRLLAHPKERIILAAGKVEEKP